ncbi:signal peptidase II [Arenimonas oryziterrae]|uniref:Lipoprotein signal peptidase n=1 Tax=Arenimonas oryziterrae DSM 21050 = YC6267 TaxID=1121015 RepID=A0A091AQK0_9GAMM|nr:signal peptidase II [Arenimonas oryziterrae]KFN41299.1 hypothetical protein N789_05330 [Arenimonas oryziterrae DSM 21050 = YC6267]
MTVANKPHPNALSWLLASVVLIALDQWTKFLAVDTLAFGESVTFIPGFWNWTLAHNTGAAFSFLANAGEWKHLFFSGLALVISTTLAVWLARTPRSDWRTALPFALIIAGALSNVVDRFRLGYVVDFVHWYLGSYDWPIFNVADSCIVVGVGLMLLTSFHKK